MSLQKSISYTFLKNGIYYYNRLVPVDVRSFYNKTRISFSLKTKSFEKAFKLSDKVSQNLESHWLSIRLQNNKFGIGHYIKDHCKVSEKLSFTEDKVTFSNALEIYLSLKGKNKPKSFVQSAERATRYLLEKSEDKPLQFYKRKDATILRENLYSKNLAGSSVVRIFNTIKAIYNFVTIEKGIEVSNPFIGIYLDRNRGITIRQPIPIEHIKVIQTQCKEISDDLRLLILLISDTGMRLSEALGLANEDLKIDEDIPYVVVQPHPWRRLKNCQSNRKIPLVGFAYYASMILKNKNQKYLFPKYIKDEICNSNSASAALNKWIKPKVPKDCTVHSFRHSMRDRLRMVYCPEELIDQLCGWSPRTTGQRYGSGYNLYQLKKEILKIL